MRRRRRLASSAGGRIRRRRTHRLPTFANGDDNRHEVAHAIDCALGGGVYRSGFDPRIRAAYAAARAFVTPYAASGLDEYFAVSVRAYAGVFNDAVSPWPAATRERLRTCDLAMHDIVAEIFA